jgi:Tol biopolymer transport system component
MIRWLGIGFLLTSLIPAMTASSKEDVPKGATERHLGNIRQLTSGRQNAEAYFSFDGTKLIFQSTNNWTAGSFAESQTGSSQDRRVLYSSTHLKSPNCPPKAKREGRYRWALDDYDIFSVRLDGQEIHRLTMTPGYDAEATISPDGKTIVFTSIRDGDLDLYAMNLDGTAVRRLTNDLGYDGGAFFSPDSRRIVYRASHPQTAEEKEAYLALLKQNLVEPSQLEIFVMNADGSGKHAVTRNGASNFAPFFSPDGRKIMYSSNEDDRQPDRRPSFHLYLINDDGTGVERITTQGHFNSFPMFSPDGKRLVWVSDRNAKAPGEFNVFLADWVP